jgi:hypothetical protein
MAHLQGTILDVCLALQESYSSVELRRHRVKLVIGRQDSYKSGVVCANLRNIRILPGAECFIAIAGNCRYRTCQKERQSDFKKYHDLKTSTAMVGESHNEGADSCKEGN